MPIALIVRPDPLAPAKLAQGSPPPPHRLTVDARERLSPQALRAGFITEAYRQGAGDQQVMHQARQKNLATTQGYRRRAGIKPIAGQTGEGNRPARGRDPAA